VRWRGLACTKFKRVLSLLQATASSLRSNPRLSKDYLLESEAGLVEDLARELWDVYRELCEET